MLLEYPSPAKGVNRKSDGQPTRGVWVILALSHPTH
jgi:hypothetical protein